MRTLLLFLSRQRWLRRFMEHSAAARTLTRRFIAGNTLQEEVAVCRQLNADGILATLDYLGENVTSVEEARTSRDTYLRSFDAIENEKLQASVSIKLTQFGLDFSVDECVANVRPLVERARRLGTRVEIDMESSEYTDRTLEVVERMHREFGCVRSVIQAYLHRSEGDIERLNAAGIPVRLCKGAYREPAEVAIQDKAEVDRNYLKLSRLLLDHGTYPAFATHDPAMIRPAIQHAKEKGIGADGFELQMLYGIRRDVQKEVSSLGYRLRLYVPYGDAWYPYFMRRLAERPANVWFLLRNLLRF
jgi:proline dehydrogenase